MMFTQLKGVALANAVILWLCSLCSITYVTLEIWLIIICDDDDDDDGGGGGGVVVIAVVVVVMLVLMLVWYGGC